MKKPIEEKMDEIIDKATAESGRPKDEIAGLTYKMTQYINAGSPYGHTSKDFMRWYQERGGRI